MLLGKPIFLLFFMVGCLDLLSPSGSTHDLFSKTECIILVFIHLHHYLCVQAKEILVRFLSCAGLSRHLLIAHLNSKNPYRNENVAALELQ